MLATRSARQGPRARGRGRLWWGLLLGLGAGCVAPGERGHYAPAEHGPGPVASAPDAGLQPCRHERDGVQFELRCQGVYTDRVDGERRRTVHLQLQVARPAPGDLHLPRGALSVEYRPPDSLISLRLLPAEVWCGPERVDGPLLVPAWTRRAFDLFFEAPDQVGQPPPHELVFSLEAAVPGRRVAQRCVFERLAADDPRGPGPPAPLDRNFGLRRGHYLPGPLDLGPRALRTAGEERLHHVFHAPGTGFRPWPGK